MAILKYYVFPQIRILEDSDLGKPRYTKLYCIMGKTVIKSQALIGVQKLKSFSKRDHIFFIFFNLPLQRINNRT